IAVIPYLTYFAHELPETCDLFEFENISREKIFLSLCSVAICDLSYQVRIVALKYLHKFSCIDEKVLERTVSRTLYVSHSNRKSYHHSQREKFSGILDTKVDDDTADSTEIVYIRRCPDGFKSNCPFFEICDYQLDAIIGALSDANHEFRTGLHRILSISCFVTAISLFTSVSFLIQNLLKFPEDINSTYNCLKLLGLRNAYMVGAVAFNLFEIHPFVETIEPLLTDTAHIGLLIVACNASSEYPPLLSILPRFYQSHLQFLRSTFPQYISGNALPSNESKLICGRVFACNTLNNFDLKSSDQIKFALNYFSTFSYVRDTLTVNIFEFSKIFLKICKNLIKINETIIFNKVVQSFDRLSMEKLFVQTISLCFQILVFFDAPNDTCEVTRLVYLVSIVVSFIRLIYFVLHALLTPRVSLRILTINL
ncbi:hypothetical protein MXB_389, partial [Myxobolus squamalis]